MDWETLLNKGYEITMVMAPKILAAAIILFLGIWGIRLFIKLLRKILLREKVSNTVIKFLMDVLRWGLNIILFIVVIAKLGVPVSSFIAAIGAAGLALGMALQGSLANFAGGILILIFRPYDVGDYISAQGITGTVRDISIFTTTLKTDGNQLAIIPNGQLSNEKIINYSVLDRRNESLTFNISYQYNLKLAKDTILKLALGNEKILKDETGVNPKVVVSKLGDKGVELLLTYQTQTANFWAAHWEMIEQVKFALDDLGINMLPRQGLDMNSDTTKD